MESRSLFLDVEYYLDEHGFLSTTEIPVDNLFEQETSSLLHDPNKTPSEYKNTYYWNSHLGKLERNEPTKIYYELDQDSTRLQLSHFTPELNAHIIKNKIQVRKIKVFKKRTRHCGSFIFTNQQELSRFILKEYCDTTIPSRVSGIIRKQRRNRKFSESNCCFMFKVPKQPPVENASTSVETIHNTLIMLGFTEKVAKKLSYLEHQHLISNFTPDELSLLVSRCSNTTLILLNTYVNDLKEMLFSHQQMVAVCMTHAPYASSNLSALLTKAPQLIKMGLDRQTIALIAACRDGDTSLNKTIEFMQQFHRGELKGMTQELLHTCLNELLHGERPRAYNLWIDYLSIFLKNKFTLEQTLEVACSKQGSECLDAMIHYHCIMLELGVSHKQIVQIAKMQQRSTIFEYIKDNIHICHDMNLTIDAFIQIAADKHLRVVIAETYARNSIRPHK